MAAITYVYINGQVVYEGEEIIYVGQDFPETEVANIDFGNAIISPGFVDLMRSGISTMPSWTAGHRLNTAPA